MNCLNKYLALVAVICVIGILMIPLSSYAGVTSGKEDAAKNDIAYWFNKGIINATYGNNKAAIKYFNKAIKFGPKNAAVNFNIGICQGELGQYQEALSFINKAIEIYPENALYHYGRGRVYLLSGNTGKSLEDFKRAAALGSRDAQNYLQNTLRFEPKEDNTEK